MFDINTVNADTLTSPGGHYGHAVCTGGLVFVSGLLPITPQGRKLTGESFEAQAEQVFRNVDCVLSALGQI
jgi:2-iminobutanoate/2-iminopropanoate deaminase